MKEGIEIVILVHSVHSRFRANDTVAIPNVSSHPSCSIQKRG